MGEMKNTARPASRSDIREENERLILDCAERVFAERGFGGATMQEIADRAGLPKANLHYYFLSKEALYRRVVERIFTIWLQAANAFETSATPQIALSTYIARKMELSREYRYGSKVWANEVMQGAPIIQDYLEVTLRDWTETRVEVIRSWVAAGQIRPVDPRWLLYMIWATTQHYADFAHQIETLNDGAPLSSDQWQDATETVCGIILRGIGLGEGAA